MESYQSILNLLQNENYILIEEFILRENNLYIDDKIDLKLLASFISDEIICSKLDFIEIANYIYKNKNKLILFSKNFINLYNIKILSRGFLVNYTIFIILSKDDEFKLIEKYLTCRKIPQRKLLLENIKLSLNIIK
jgi:hypothetical protein